MFIIMADKKEQDQTPTRCDISKPDTAKPDVVQPDVAQPDVAQPDVAQPDVAQLDIAYLSSPWFKNLVYAILHHVLQLAFRVPK